MYWRAGASSEETGKGVEVASSNSSSVHVGTFQAPANVRTAAYALGADQNPTDAEQGQADMKRDIACAHFRNAAGFPAAPVLGVRWTPVRRDRAWPACVSLGYLLAIALLPVVAPQCVPQLLAGQSWLVLGLRSEQFASVGLCFG